MNIKNKIAQGDINKKVLAMEEYCLKDELEFLHCFVGGNLRQKIDGRIGHLSARIKLIEENKKLFVKHALSEETK